MASGPCQRLRRSSTTKKTERGSRRRELVRPIRTRRSCPIWSSDTRKPLSLSDALAQAVQNPQAPRPPCKTPALPAETRSQSFILCSPFPFFIFFFYLFFLPLSLARSSLPDSASLCRSFCSWQVVPGTQPFAPSSAAVSAPSLFCSLHFPFQEQPRPLGWGREGTKQKKNTTTTATTKKGKMARNRGAWYLLSRSLPLSCLHLGCLPTLPSCAIVQCSAAIRAPSFLTRSPLPTQLISWLPSRCHPLPSPCLANDLMSLQYRSSC